MKINIIKIIILFASFFSIQIHALKILCITASFPVVSETFILNQLTGLIDRGHDVYIYATHKRTDSVAHTHLEKYHLSDRTHYQSLPANLSVDVTLCQFGQLYETYKELQTKYNLQSKKVITFFRGSDAMQARNTPSPYYKTLFQECDLIMPVCHYLKNLLLKAGCNPQKIIVHHSAIDCSKFAFKSRSIAKNEPIHLVSTGRLVEKKGIEFAIRAVAIAKEKYPTIQYTIIGSGPLAHHLQSLIDTLHLNDNVHLVGQQNQEYIIRTLDTAHIFLLPSITAYGNIEGIANALKEAMAMGIPVIGTRHSGTPELITDGVSGFLVPERDISALAEKIIYLIEHPEVWPSFGQAGRIKIEEEFETEKENNKLVKILESLIRKK